MCGGCVGCLSQVLVIVVPGDGEEDGRERGSEGAREGGTDGRRRERGSEGAREAGWREEEGREGGRESESLPKQRLTKGGAFPTTRVQLPVLLKEPLSRFSPQ